MTAERCIFSSCSSSVPPRPLCRKRIPDRNGPNDASCNIASPPPARRRTGSTRSFARQSTAGRSWCWTAQTFVLAILFALLFCARGAEAARGHSPAQELEERMPELLIDTSVPPAPVVRVVKRDETTTAQAASTASSSGTLTASGTTGGIDAPSPTSDQSPLPLPFDTSLGNNFTTPTCPDFFHSFLGNETFQKCRPFSLLLQTSNSFFSVSRSLVRLTQTLGATCNVDFTQCSQLMASLADEIQQDENCGADLQMQNPMVVQAYNGFVAYQPLYHAGCLQDNNGNYCFATAVTNTSSPTSSYIYYLPLGVQLPGGTRPACNNCMQNTMQVFASFASNSSEVLADTYSPAAQQIDIACGPSFVEASVQVSAAARPTTTTSACGLGLLLLVAAASSLLNLL